MNVSQLTIEEKRGSNHFRYKALTLRQPYAFMISKGTKTIEVRSKRTNYRGDIVITVSKEPEFEGLLTGVAVCIAEIYDCRDFHEKDYFYAKWKPADCDDKQYYSWYLRNIILIEPFEVKGNLGIWTLYTNKAIKYKGLYLKNRLKSIINNILN